MNEGLAQTDPKTRRPPLPVILACALMAGLALLDAATGIFIATQMSGDGGFFSDRVAQFAVGLTAIKMLIAGVFAVFIWRGQSWSRIAYSVLTVLILLMSLASIRSAALLSPLLQFASMVLLFLPAADRWFAFSVPATPDGVATFFMPMQADMISPDSLPAPRPAARPAARGARPATLKFGVGLMFVVLGLGLWCACLIIATWMATWPDDDSALASMFALIPYGALMLGDIFLSVVSAVMIWNGFGVWRFVYGSVTALGLRLIIGVLPISPGRAIILYAACLACFTLLFLPPSNRWFRARLA